MISVENNMADEIDRQILHALHMSPRLSFRTLAEVLGVSDQTAARRYRKLVESAGLRVLGVVNAAKAGWVDWVLRLQTAPGGAQTIADALARRPDTRWVQLCSGGAEIICVLQARTPEQRNSLFLQGIPGSRRVVQISAHAILHTYTVTAWSEVTGSLTPDQLALLPARTRPERPAALQPEDGPLLAELSRDGRIGYAALADATHRHESAVRRRLDELTDSGLLYYDVDIDDHVLGFGVQALLWLSVEPAQLAAVGRALAAHREVAYAAATTGSSNLVASCLFRDTNLLYEYLTVRLSDLPGIRSVESSPVIGTVKRTGAL